MNPQVSIIVPAYNAEAYIGSCLDHLCALDYAHYEVILVNDGSTDRTAEVAKTYCEHVRVIDIPNSGVSVARNVGLAQSRGEFVLFCDADDYYLPDALSTLVALLDDEVDIVAAQSFSGKSPKIHKNSFTITGREMAINSLYQKPGFTPSPWGKLYRRTLFDSSAQFRPGIRYEDLDLTLRLFTRARKVVVTDAQVYFYRQHSGSFLHKWSDGRLDSLKVTEGLVAESPEFGQQMEQAARSRRNSAAWNLLLPAIRHGQKEIARRCLEIIRQSRGESLTDPNVRLKNKLAGLLAYLLF